MASLLERLSIPSNSTGPVRSKGSPGSGRASSTPYTRPPKGDVNATWSHDLFEGSNATSGSRSLSDRLKTTPSAPRANFNSTIAQKALREATGSSLNSDSQLSIKGAGSSGGNVVEVTGLVRGTTPDDVSAIFKRCGTITHARLVPSTVPDNVTIRVTFKTPASAADAVQKFHNQPADGKTLVVKVVGTASTGTTLGGRLGGLDGLGLVREEGSVDVLMEGGDGGGSKMRSDSLLHADPRAHILLAPPGMNPAEYISSPASRGRRGRGTQGRRGRKGPGGNGNAKMDIDT